MVKNSKNFLTFQQRNNNRVLWSSFFTVLPEPKILYFTNYEEIAGGESRR